MFQLYFDDSKRTVEEKIAGVLRMYQEKYGVKPGMVLCHPEQTIHRADVLIVTGDSQGLAVQKNTFWCGLS